MDWLESLGERERDWRRWWSISALIHHHHHHRPTLPPRPSANPQRPSSTKPSKSTTLNPKLSEIFDSRSKNASPMGSKRPSFGDGASPGKILIGGLAKDTTIGTLVNYFTKYGDLTDLVILKDR
ncbi:putative nucleotide-binding alpha-beta plait domain superfamily, RNA-binding domain superfamily [Helianthus annuus]|uniref:Putative nucleotide-binding alpha-beta plait domain-containing protein n=1 Tax=Helianthus annuus TaxID=4232 RepID=A0A251VAH9_HELAN|nr:putative nucleotide-binding alpha-beta plait domain superfamily, RNA-binding domain superfamily [Helianthus annuus]KAJ0944442.1 putative RNA-binding domain superfamily [Helianthus annuus]